MSSDTTLLSFADPTQLILEIPPTAQEQAWQKSQAFSTAASRYQAYLNQICLSTVLPWLQEEYDSAATAWPSAAALNSFWEFVNGTAAVVDGTRLVFVPSEAIDNSQLRVPQEWVDIPSWAADYYLAVQVEPDQGWVKIWSYCTHQMLKNQESYDPSDRTYCLDENELIKDLNALWVARQLCPDEPTRAAIAPLQTLSLAQAENLIARLGDLSVITPRLEVPFALWGTLLEHGGWRKRLSQSRRGEPEQWSIFQWLASGVSNLAQQFAWEKVELQPDIVGARAVEQKPTTSILSRQLIIAGQPYELQIIPQGKSEERIWRFQLSNPSPGGRIPAGFKLRLLSEDLQAFENNEVIATTAVESLYIEVALETGEGLVWEVKPTPLNYDREILRF